MRQVLNSIKLAFQNLLGPLTHQVTGCIAHILLYIAQLTWCLTDMTLGLRIRGKKRKFYIYYWFWQGECWWMATDNCLTAIKKQTELILAKQSDNRPYSCQENNTLRAESLEVVGKKTKLYLHPRLFYKHPNWAKMVFEQMASSLARYSNMLAAVKVNDMGHAHPGYKHTLYWQHTMFFIH